MRTYSSTLEAVKRCLYMVIPPAIYKSNEPAATEGLEDFFSESPTAADNVIGETQHGDWVIPLG